MSDFAAPLTASAGPKAADLAGQLLIITPNDYRKDIDTVNGKADAISCDIINLDTNETHSDVLFFNIAIRNALKNLIGRKVLCRIQQGVAKPGKTAPWILADASTDAAAVAKANAYNGAAPAAKPATTVINGTEVPADVAALLAQLGAKPV
jgi:hypothetical protein